VRANISQSLVEIGCFLVERALISLDSPWAIWLFSNNRFTLANSCGAAMGELMIARLEKLARLAVLSAVLFGILGGSLLAAYQVGYGHGYEDGLTLKRKYDRLTGAGLSDSPHK
jgi:hypothetical protein